MGAKLRHPNIVPIFEVHSDRRGHFMVMDFIEGRDLREFVRVRKKLAPEEALRFSIDIAAGLAYAAEFGIRHRDLKLSNVLMSQHRPSAACRFWFSSSCDHRGRIGRRQSTNNRLRGTGTFDRCTKRRPTQRHLFCGLHVLQHDYWSPSTS